MNEAVDLRGAKLIVLTEAEYAELLEDAGDIALADEALAQGGPSMPAHLLTDELDGKLHPLAAWRKSAGLTQTQLGARSGVRPATISDIESGRVDPRLSTVKALAAALGLGVEDIID